MAFEELQVSSNLHTSLCHSFQHNYLQKYIQEMIQERIKSYRDYSDLFSNLIAANENDGEGLRLTDQEMIGNIFIFLIGKSREPFTILVLPTYSWV
jgi:hypothetical protein